MTINDRRTQTGLSLIELMIGVTLGLFLLIGVVSIFISTNQNARASEDLSRIQENGRFAVEFINAELRKAGYRPDVTAPFEDAFTADGLFDAGQIVAGTGASITVRYWGSGTPADGSVLDCLGTPVAATDLRSVTIDITGGSLTCEVDGGGAQPVVDSIAANPGIFTYAIDTNGDFEVDNAPGAPCLIYRPATGGACAVGPALDPRWRQVLAVRYALQIVRNDISQTFRSTIGLRNRLK